MKKNDIVRLQGLKITILEVNETGPTRIEFKFDLSLDDERFRFFKLNEGKLVLTAPPETGQSITI